MQLGDTFLIPKLDDHLWIIISDPQIDPVNVVIVLLNTWTESLDQACILDAREHPFVKHSTCVNFPGAQLVTDAALEQQKAFGALKLKPECSSQLLSKIHASVESSDIKSSAYEVLRDQGLLP